MKIISKDTVTSLVTYADAVQAMREGFTALAEGRVEAPDEFMMHHPTSGDVHVKGAHVHGSPWMVVKVVSGGFAMPGNHGCSFVMSAQTGAIEFLIDDGGWLTEVRTAAAGALSIDLLARTNATRLAIIGAGVQAQFQLDALRVLRPSLTDICVSGRNVERLQQFAERNECSVATSIDDAIDGADVVLCATTSHVPLVHRVAPGVHVTSIGVDTAGKCELGASLLADADAVVVDDIALARRAGILQGAPSCAAVTLGDLLAGRVPGRTTDRSITVAGLSGVGVQDAAIAQLLISRLAPKTVSSAGR